MSQLLSVDRALEQILDNVAVTSEETVTLSEASGRVLAKSLRATRTQPPFPASAMDGYAVRAQDVTQTPVKLNLIGQSAAGHGFDGQVVEGQCVRIFTGAPVPDGANTIVIQENVVADGDWITIEQGESAGRYIRPAGFDFTRGDELIGAGTELNSATISLAAAMNIPKIPVRRKPLVAIVATGDELVLPGTDPAPDQIVASNSLGVAAIVSDAGGAVLDLGIARDTLGSLAEKFALAVDADIVITLGGASVGDHDLVAQALQDRHVELRFWKLAMRPGKPVMLGVSHESEKRQRYIGLPGNPVSSLVCAHIFLVPLIKSMLGLDPVITRVPARLARNLPANDQREEYMRATHCEIDGEIHVTPFDNQDSSMLTLMARATCLMIRPAFAEAMPVGSNCEIIWL